MNKEELVKAIAQHSGLTKKVSEEALNALMQVVRETVAEKQKVVLVGFGTFETRARAERRAVNPRTREEILVPAQSVPFFKAGKEFKDRVSGKSPEDTQSEAAATPPVKKKATK